MIFVDEQILQNNVTKGLEVLKTIVHLDVLFQLISFHINLY